MNFFKGPLALSERRTFSESFVFSSDDYPQKNNLQLFSEKTSTSLHKNHKNLLVKCSGTQISSDESYHVKYNSWNAPDHQLIKPINASISISVSCKQPKALQIFLLKEDEPLFDHNTARLHHAGLIHVKNNEFYYFQVWAFDRLNTPFYNFSSLNITWTITKSPETHFEAFKYHFFDFFENKLN